MPNVRQARPALNRWAKKSANLGADMALFGTPSHTPSCPFFPILLVDLCYRCWSCPNHCLTDWGREPLSVQHMSLRSQRVKCRYDRPLSAWSSETSMTISFIMGHCWRMSANLLTTMGNQGASIQHGATRIKSLNWPVTCSVRNLDRTRGTNAGGGKS